MRATLTPPTPQENGLVRLCVEEQYVFIYGFANLFADVRFASLFTEVVSLKANFLRDPWNVLGRTELVGILSVNK